VLSTLPVAVVESEGVVIELEHSVKAKVLDRSMVLVNA
jgi:hypothetical protein